MSYKPKNFTGLFIISNPRMLLDTLILGRKYKRVIVIITLSKEHTENSRKAIISELKNNIPDIKIIDIHFDNQWSIYRKAAIAEGKKKLKPLINQINIEKSDVYCSPNCCAISLLMSLKTKINILQHGDHEIFNNMFPIIRKLYTFYKYGEFYKGANAYFGCVRLKRFFRLFINYHCIWDDFTNDYEKRDDQIYILLWPESNVWDNITDEQIELANSLLDLFINKTSIKDNQIFIKFHPRQLAKLNQEKIDKGIKELNIYKDKCTHIAKLNKNLEYLPVEMVYYLLNPKHLYSIDFGSMTSWNLSCLPNTTNYSLQFELSTYLLKSLKKRHLFSRLILHFIVDKPPINLYLRKKRY